MIKQMIKAMISMFGNYIPVRSKINVEEARNCLQKFSPKPRGFCYTKNNIDIQYDLQIIIPAYNAEKYINQCLESVLIQKSKYKTLVTIINDGSTDGTSDILESFSKKSGLSQMVIEVINQNNKGYSGARNAALKTIKGKYVMLLDSDDVIPENTINSMVEAAITNNADILQGSWYTFTNDRREEHIIKEDEKEFSGYPWGKLYKYSVLEHFQFPDGYWFEDTPISFILAAMPFKCVTIKDIIYGYRLNPEGITAKAIYSNKSIDSYWITEECLQEFPKFNLSYDQRAYEYLLRQSRMNAGRTCKQPRKICESQFVLTGELMDTYFKGFCTENKKMKKIESSLRKRQFIRFSLVNRGM